MNTNQLQALHRARGDLKLKGKFEEAIPYQLQILEIVQATGTIVDLSNAWNYLSTLYHIVGRYEDAEVAARNALQTYEDEPHPSDEVVACYEMKLAKILASQNRFAEAAMLGESAVKHYSVFHNPPDRFLQQVREEVERMTAHRDRQSSYRG